jgi:hypothetical protein
MKENNSVESIKYSGAFPTIPRIRWNTSHETRDGLNVLHFDLKIGNMV